MSRTSLGVQSRSERTAFPLAQAKRARRAVLRGARDRVVLRMAE